MTYVDALSCRPVVRASKLGVSLPGLGEEFHDQVRFACDIGSAVCPEQWGELVLEPGVTGGLAGICTQEVPQIHVITMCLAAVDDDVEVVIDRARRRPECVPARDAQITFVLPSSGRQRADGRGHGSLIRYHYVEIDDGLGVQARDSGTADMHRDVANASQRCVYLAAQSFELPWPPRVVRDDNGWNVHQATFRDNGGPARIIIRMQQNATRHAPRRTRSFAAVRWARRRALPLVSPRNLPPHPSPAGEAIQLSALSCREW
jgi:hypothetical protein